MKGFNKKVQSQTNKASSLHKLISQATKLFISTYVSDELAFGKRIINNIIYNEKSHCVALFKDYLILDDSSEFLKRYYSTNESDERLPRFFEYYETYSKIFPNYTSIFEGKYIYRNIQKKQKMIDLQERMEIESNIKKNNHSENSDEVFSTDVYDSIINDRNNEDLESIFNLNERSVDFHDKIVNIILDIKNNDTYNLNHNINKSNNNSNQNIATPTSNGAPKLNKHKMLISSLLGRNKYINVNSKNRFMQSKDKHLVFISSHNSCDSFGQIKHGNFSSINKINDNQISNANFNVNAIGNNTNGNREKNEGKLRKAKLLSNYPKTIVIDNSAIQKLRNKEDITTTPLTQRENYRFKYNELTLTQLKEYNEKKKKGHKMYIKTPPKLANNFTYRINPCPKITTHVTLYNNNSSNASTKNTNNTQQLSGRTNSNVQSKVSSKRPSATFQYKNNLPSNNRDCCLTGRTRNTKANINNNLMLKSNRNKSTKNKNLLRTTSQPSMPMNSNDKFYTTKYTMKQNKSRPTSINRTRSLSVCNHQPNKIKIPVLNNNNSMRKELAPHINHSVYNQSKKQIIKGIQINNFSKVFSINCSQSASDRLDRKNNHR